MKNTHHRVQDDVVLLLISTVLTAFTKMENRKPARQTSTSVRATVKKKNIEEEDF